ncbi:glycerol dehydrogenase [Acinetobacter populi]|jgi:glycerol dehydrogenase|uniref:glycerol dehydrogenase n=1 Tax=Acinetobacter populi TaxID=1582270 RepID=UPI002355BC3B|nr:glycerol dehydrogenase [Acinetobacter populi]
MERLVFGSPMRYIQGWGVLNEALNWLNPNHQNICVVTDAFVLDLIQPTLQAQAKQKNLAIDFVVFDQAITSTHLQHMFDQVRPNIPDIVLAAGGGLSIDAGKALAHQFNLPFITIPTVASNDAPTSKNYVVYTDHHQMDYVGHLDFSPWAVIVDSQIISKAPKKFLLAGIGDAISKKFEARACLQSQGKNMFATRSSITAVAIGDACFEQIQQHAQAALAIAGTGKSSDALEMILEASILMSGLAFESGGLSIAHAMTRGLTAIPETSRQMHGLQVAYGLLVQLYLDQQHEELDQLIIFYKKIGLPVALKQLGLTQIDTATLHIIADLTLAAPHCKNFSSVLTQQDLVAAMQHIENLDRQER